jgi:hypothetical protein
METGSLIRTARKAEVLIDLSCQLKGLLRSIVTTVWTVNKRG